MALRRRPWAGNVKAAGLYLQAGRAQLASLVQWARPSRLMQRAPRLTARCMTMRKRALPSSIPPPGCCISGRALAGLMAFSSKGQRVFKGLPAQRALQVQQAHQVLQVRKVLSARRGQLVQMDQPARRVQRAIRAKLASLAQLALQAPKVTMVSQAQPGLKVTKAQGLTSSAHYQQPEICRPVVLKVTAI